MDSSFALIDSLRHFLDPLPARWFVSGGWAIDVHLDRVTRKRCDLDVSVPFGDRLACIRFFLAKGWRIEGKLGGGFRTLHAASDYCDDIRYFWSFPEGVGFVSEYVDGDGNRRIAYNRDFQQELDYVEVFFDVIEDGQFVYRRDPRVRRHEEQAILERDGMRYLAPEVVLLFKSNALSEKNSSDFDAAVGSLDDDASAWLVEALSLLYKDAHPWLGRLEANTCQIKRGWRE